MALTNKHRSSIYQGLVPILGEEEVEALLSQFPSRDLDEPVTKEFVRAEISDVRTEIAGVRAELHTEIAGVRTEVAELRAELHTEIAALRAEMHEGFRQMTVWMAGAMTAGLGLAAAVGAAVG